MNTPSATTDPYDILFQFALNQKSNLIASIKDDLERSGLSVLLGYLEQKENDPAFLSFIEREIKKAIVDQWVLLADWTTEYKERLTSHGEFMWFFPQYEFTISFDRKKDSKGYGKGPLIEIHVGSAKICVDKATGQIYRPGDEANWTRDAVLVEEEKKHAVFRTLPGIFLAVRTTDDLKGKTQDTARFLQFAPAPSEYRYGLRSRPASIGAVPPGSIRIDPTSPLYPRLTRHGVVVYAKPLTQDQVKDYELTPYIEADELVRRTLDWSIKEIDQAEKNSGVSGFRRVLIRKLDEDPKTFRGWLDLFWKNLGPFFSNELTDSIQQKVQKAFHLRYVE
jgi:hypothetical protein